MEGERADDVVSQARVAESVASGVTSAWLVACSIEKSSKCRRTSGSRSCRSRFGRMTVRGFRRSPVDSSGRSSSDRNSDRNSGRNSGRNFGRNSGRSFGRKIGCCPAAAGCC